jgi:hypothetical protein
MLIFPLRVTKSFLAAEPASGLARRLRAMVSPCEEASVPSEHLGPFTLTRGRRCEGVKGVKGVI